MTARRKKRTRRRNPPWVIVLPVLTGAAALAGIVSNALVIRKHLAESDQQPRVPNALRRNPDLSWPVLLGVIFGSMFVGGLVMSAGRFAPSE